jgi:hypothetical protein
VHKPRGGAVARCRYVPAASALLTPPARTQGYLWMEREGGWTGHGRARVVAVYYSSGDADTSGVGSALPHHGNCGSPLSVALSVLERV